MTQWIAHLWNGQDYYLPKATKWRIDYGLGFPCDGFSFTCPWQKGQEDLLPEICRVTVKQEGQTVFVGLLDECICSWGEMGAQLEISGRGMQARLLDNEAMGADFGVATIDEILRRYVTPYGISVGEKGYLTPVAGFSVATGSSCWQVLYQFARYHAGVTPRVDRYGTLLLTPFSQAPDRKLDKKLPLTQVVLRHKRYGVLSKVQVVNQVTKGVQEVENADFRRRGGSCSRVLSVPRKTSYQAMRYNGEFQLKKSQQELFQIALTVGTAFAAFPGELLTVENTAWPITGLWRVVESAVTLDGQGTKTRLTLAPPDVLL